MVVVFVLDEMRTKGVGEDRRRRFFRFMVDISLGRNRCGGTDDGDIMSTTSSLSAAENESCEDGKFCCGRFFVVVSKDEMDFCRALLVVVGTSSSSSSEEDDSKTISRCPMVTVKRVVVGEGNLPPSGRESGKLPSVS